METYAQNLATEVHFGEISVASLKDAIAGTGSEDDAKKIARAIAAGEISIAEVEKIIADETEYEAYLEEMMEERHRTTSEFYAALREDYDELPDNFWRNKKTGSILEAGLYYY